jgi:hypothetical protein
VLNKDVIKEWVDALRSGEYEQGSGALATYREFDNAKGEYGDWVPLDKPRFCCLGVLCDIAEKNGVTTGTEDKNGATISFDGQQGLPPAAVEDWAGVRAWEVGWPGDVDRQRAGAECSPGCDVCADMNNRMQTTKIGLASLNDNHDYTFPQIADAIEKEWLNV